MKRAITLTRSYEMHLKAKETRSLTTVVNWFYVNWLDLFTHSIRRFVIFTDWSPLSANLSQSLTRLKDSLHLQLVQIQISIISILSADNNEIILIYKTASA